MKTLFAAAALSLLSLCASAKPLRPARCADIPEIERASFEATLVHEDRSRAFKGRFLFRGCRLVERDDLEPGYEERVYENGGGLSLYLVTATGPGAYGQGAPDSTRVLLAENGQWVADFGLVANAALLARGKAVETPLAAVQGARGRARLSLTPIGE